MHPRDIACLDNRDDGFASHYYLYPADNVQTSDDPEQDLSGIFTPPVNITSDGSVADRRTLLLTATIDPSS